MTEDPEITVGLLAAEFDSQYPDSAPEWVAERAVASLRAADRKRLLVDLLVGRIEARRRQKARDIEQRATAMAEHERITRAHEQGRQEFLASHRDRCDIEHRGLDGGYSASEACDRKLAGGTDEGQRRREQWHRTRAEGVERRTQEADKERLRVEDPDAFEERYSPMRAFQRAVEDFRNEVRLELTIELLGSAFSLGDGRSTTWGAATVGQHEQRVALLMRGMEGTAQTVVLHEKAIELLNERAAMCLNDVRFAA